jgi:hypothetical protein
LQQRQLGDDLERERKMSEPSPRVRSTIVKVPDATPGMLFINGQQKQFNLDGVWKSPVAPAANMAVDVELDAGGAITGITAVDPNQANKERMAELSNVAQEKGKEAAKLAQQGIGALAAKMGATTLGAAVLVWIAWFFLPAAGIGGGFVGSMSFTFWNLLGIDFDNPLTMTASGGSHGFFAILGILAIAAPFAAPYIKAAWSKYLNAAPLGFVVIGFIMVYMQVNKAFGDLAKMGAPNPFSWSWGLFVLLIAAAVVGMGALKKSA